MRYEVEELESAFIDLVKRERPIVAVFAVILSFIPSLLLVSFVIESYLINLIAVVFVVPIINGLLARYSGRLFTAASRIPSTIIYIFLYIGFGILTGGTVWWYLFIPISAAVFYTTSRVKFTRVQEFAVERHAIKPFDVKVNPNYKKILMPFLPIGLIIFTGAYFWNKISYKCLLEIGTSKSSSVISSCSFERYQTLEEMANSDEGVVINVFGTFNNPTEEAQLIKQLADLGDPFYQQFYWVILNKIYLPEITLTNKYLVETYFKERDDWLAIAADSGFEPAMSEMVNLLLRNNPATEEQKTTAIKLANRLVEKNVKNAELLNKAKNIISEEDIEYSNLGGTDTSDAVNELLNKAQQIISDQDIKDLYLKQSNSFEALELDQLENILHAFENGEFFYNSSDFQTDGNAERDYTRSISVAKQKDKVIDVLKVMSDKFNNVDASYRVFERLLGKSDSIEVLKYLTRAAEHGHIGAHLKLGAYYYCINRKVDSLTWLKKAIEAGDDKAIELQRKVIRSEPIPECNGNDIRL